MNAIVGDRAPENSRKSCRELQRVAESCRELQRIPERAAESSRERERTVNRAVIQIQREMQRDAEGCRGQRRVLRQDSHNSQSVTVTLLFHSFNHPQPQYSIPFFVLFLFLSVFVSFLLFL
jgi:hypothetical protein